MIKLNAQKYGHKGDDIISRSLKSNWMEFKGFCKWNMVKYLERYIRINDLPWHKQIVFKIIGKGTKKDLVKAMDYYDRFMAEHKRQKRKHYHAIDVVTLWENYLRNDKIDI